MTESTGLRVFKSNRKLPTTIDVTKGKTDITWRNGSDSPVCMFAKDWLSKHSLKLNGYLIPFEWGTVVEMGNITKDSMIGSYVILVTNHGSHKSTLPELLINAKLCTEQPEFNWSYVDTTAYIMEIAEIRSESDTYYEFTNFSMFRSKRAVDKCIHLRHPMRHIRYATPSWNVGRGCIKLIGFMCALTILFLFLYYVLWITKYYYVYAWTMPMEHSIPTGNNTADVCPSMEFAFSHGLKTPHGSYWDILIVTSYYMSTVLTFLIFTILTEGLFRLNFWKN